MKPIRLGLVGLNFGYHICHELCSISDLPVYLAAVCDKDAEKAHGVAHEFHVPIASSLDALLADDNIDAIALYTGPNGRAELVRQIIHAGKDVMTTKPFEIDPETAYAVLTEAQSLGRVVHMNSPNPKPLGEMSLIYSWVNSGAIGKPTIAQGNVWNYYGETDPDGSWYDDPRRCPLAPMFRLGIYQLNDLLPIFGTPKTVQVAHSRVVTKRPTPDNASMTITFANGGIVNLVASLVVGGPDRYKNSLTIGGTRGVIYYATGPRRPNGDQRLDLLLSTNERQETHVCETHSGMYDWHFFAQRVRGEVAQDVTTPAEVAMAIRVIKAMSLAEQTGDMIAVATV